MVKSLFVYWGRHDMQHGDTKRSLGDFSKRSKIKGEEAYKRMDCSQRGRRWLSMVKSLTTLTRASVDKEKGGGGEGPGDRSGTPALALPDKQTSPTKSTKAG